MPRSKPSPRRRATKARSRQRRIPEDDAPLERKRKRPRWQARVGWTMAIVGGILFLIGNVGARTGSVFLPFDPHHVFGQVGGAVVAFIGILLATAG